LITANLAEVLLSWWATLKALISYSLTNLRLLRLGIFLRKKRHNL